MWDLAVTTTQRARKDYPCGAWEWISNSGYSERDFKPEDWQVIENARADDFMIKKGTEYTQTKGKWEGEFCTFRARIDLDKICSDYDLYPDD